MDGEADKPKAATRRTGIRGWLGCLPRFLFLLLLTFVFLTWLDDFRVTWNPKDWVDEAVYLIGHRPVEVPAETPPLTGKAAELVDARLAKAFYLVQSDPQTAPLAQMAADKGIRIEVTDQETCGTPKSKACMKMTCPPVQSDRLVVFPELLNMNTYFLAGILVHELTHERNLLDKPEYYCSGHYLSDEFQAFKNQQYFKRPYERFGIFDYFDRQGNFHPYCLYWLLKKAYTQSKDDMNLPPSDNFVEQHLCNNFNDLLTY